MEIVIFTVDLEYQWVWILAELILMVGGVGGFVEVLWQLPQGLPQLRHLRVGPLVPAPSVLFFPKLFDTNNHVVRRFSGSLRLYDLISLSALKLEIKFVIK